MNNFINYLIESGISIACFTTLYLLVFQRGKNLQFNRFYLLGSVLISLLIPAIKLETAVIPTTQVLPTIYLEATDIHGYPKPAGSNSIDFLITAYIAVACFMLFLLARKIRNIKNIMGRCFRENDYNVMKISRSEEAFSFLDTIYIGDNIPPDRKDIILKHELAHIRQLHSLDILFFEIVSCLFWINPLFKKIKKLAEINHEFMADEAVTRHADTNRYIQILSQETLKKLNFSLGLHFYSSNALKRIKMLRERSDSSWGVIHLTPVFLVSALVFFFSCENLEGQLDDITDEQGVLNLNVNEQTADQQALGKVYDIVEEVPEPEGGMAGFYQYVAANMEYPVQARKAGVQGKIFVQFICDKNGELKEVTVLKGIGAGCDKEALRVVSNAPKWKPGRQDHENVAVRMILPITFKLDDSPENELLFQAQQKERAKQDFLQMKAPPKPKSDYSFTVSIDK